MDVLRDAARAGLLLLPDESLDGVVRLDGCVLRYRSSATPEDVRAAIALALSGDALSSGRHATPRPASVPHATPSARARRTAG